MGSVGSVRVICGICGICESDLCVGGLWDGVVSSAAAVGVPTHCVLLCRRPPARLASLAAHPARSAILDALHPAADRPQKAREKSVSNELSVLY